MSMDKSKSAEAVLAQCDPSVIVFLVKTPTPLSFILTEDGVVSWDFGHRIIATADEPDRSNERELSLTKIGAGELSDSMVNWVAIEEMSFSVTVPAGKISIRIDDGSLVVSSSVAIKTSHYGKVKSAGCMGFRVLVGDKGHPINLRRSQDVANFTQEFGDGRAKKFYEGMIFQGNEIDVGNCSIVGNVFEPWC